MADFYAREAENFTSQGLVTAACMANIHTSKRTLEVACGPGSHSVMLATNFIPKDAAVLVSCDFSKNMMKKLKQNYSESDYVQAKGNLAVIDDTINIDEKCDIEEIIKK
jgi:ubiquinone/menaquinone biosynthesis C-methylase UbiE